MGHSQGRHGQHGFWRSSVSALQSGYPVALRTAAGAHCLVPGLSGWLQVQVHGRGALPIAPTVAVGAQYVHRHSVWFDTRVVWVTLLTVIKRDGVIH